MLCCLNVIPRSRQELDFLSYKLVFSCTSDRIEILFPGVYITLEVVLRCFCCHWCWFVWDHETHIGLLVNDYIILLSAKVDQID